jgi:hypothetical protein
MVHSKSDIDWKSIESEYRRADNERKLLERIEEIRRRSGMAANNRQCQSVRA